MALLYEGKRMLGTPQPVMIKLDTQQVAINPYGAAQALVTAIRIQDIARNKWYSWDVTNDAPHGSWNNAGGSGKNAPVGEMPMVTPGSNNLYIAFYATNMGSAGNLTLLLKNSGGYVLNTQTVSVASAAGAGIEWTGNMPTAPLTLTLSATP